MVVLVFLSNNFGVLLFLGNNIILMFDVIISLWFVMLNGVVIVVKNSLVIWVMVCMLLVFDMISVNLFLFRW